MLRPHRFPILFAAFAAALMMLNNAAGAVPESAVAARREAQARPGAAERPGLNRHDLAIWRDPEFQRRFMESYIAETEIEPSLTDDERTQMQRVLDFMADDEVDEALELLERYRSDGNSAVFDFTAGNIHFQSDRLDEAAQAYEIAVDKHPKFRRAWRNLGMIRMRQNELAQAIPALRRVIELGGGEGIIYGLLGYAYGTLENHISAESAYRMAILLDPDTNDWKMGLARSFFQQERFADAVALTQLLIDDEPSRAELWQLQANAYLGMNQPMRAAENFELADRLGGSTRDSLYMLGDIYINEGAFELAVDAYGRAVQLDSAPDSAPDVDRPLRAAQVMAARGAHDETAAIVNLIEATFSSQLTADQEKDLLKLRARLAVAAGASGEEARVLEQIVEIDPLDGEALMLLGQHAARNDDVERAVFYYERAAKIEGHEADALVRHGQLLVSLGRYGEALPLLQRGQQLKPRETVQRYIEQVERIAKSR